MYSIAIIDDHNEVQNRILHILKNSKYLVDIHFICYTYSSSESFLKSPENRKFNILILDIELPGINGLELAKKLRLTHKDMYIIFLTSYDHYMKDAFGLNVYQYILKEDMENELPKTTRKLMNAIMNENPSKVLFKTSEGEVLVREDEIVCVVYENRHPVIYTKTSSHIVIGKTLIAIFEGLSPLIFAQPNNSTIINIRYINRIASRDVSLNYYRGIIQISRGRYKRIKNLYTQYLMQGESL